MMATVKQCVFLTRGSDVYPLSSSDCSVGAPTCQFPD